VFNWLKSLFKGKTYTVTVSYNNKFGDSDDKTWRNAKKIYVSNWKELKFRTTDKKLVHVKDMNGLHYWIEQN
jgi:hypothetical protein